MRSGTGSGSGGGGGGGAEVTGDGEGAAQTDSREAVCDRADARLLAGIRRADRAALEEFVMRFTPLLLYQARQLGIPSSERCAAVTTFLDTMLMRIAAGSRPRFMKSYLVRAFRNEVLGAVREGGTEEQRLEQHSEDHGDTRIVAAVCSEYMIRAAVCPGAELLHSSARDVALVHLVAHLTSTMSERERELVGWLAHRVPARDIARWLGISYAATRVRISRLRARMVQESLRYRDGLPAGERVYLDSIFERVELTGRDRPLAHDVAGDGDDDA
jgi:DNA-directed RNA polymerase specialized sigma24 family protein